jgi:hypothetical protein
LHATRLRIKILGESEASEFEAPLPEDLILVIDQLKVIAEYE